MNSKNVLLLDTHKNPIRSTSGPSLISADQMRIGRISPLCHVLMNNHSLYSFRNILARELKVSSCFVLSSPICMNLVPSHNRSFLLFYCFFFVSFAISFQFNEPVGKELCTAHMCDRNH